MLSFVAGIVAGGMAGYYCRDEISGYLNRQMPPIREQLAKAVHTVEEETSGALTRFGTALSSKLRNAEQSLRTTNHTASAGDR
jgi:hypothetical protein